MNLPAIKAAAQAVLDAYKPGVLKYKQSVGYWEALQQLDCIATPAVVLEMATALESVRTELHELEEWMKCHTVPESLKVIAGLIRAAIGEGK